MTVNEATAREYLLELRDWLTRLDRPRETFTVKGKQRAGARRAAVGVLRYSNAPEVREEAREALTRLAIDGYTTRLQRYADVLRSAGATIPPAAVLAAAEALGKQAAAQSIAEAEAGRLRVAGGGWRV